MVAAAGAHSSPTRAALGAGRRHAGHGLPGAGRDRRRKGRAVPDRGPELLCPELLCPAHPGSER